MKKSIDTIELIQTLSDIHHYGKSSDKDAVAKLITSKHILESGKLSKSGLMLVESWYARGSDRVQILKSLG